MDSHDPPAPLPDGATRTQLGLTGVAMIGEYRVLRLIGEGGMGMVYEAEQQHPRRLVALKVIRGGRLVSDEHVKLFQREAQALARLRHPGIAAIYESGRTHDGQHYFAMELVRGTALSDYLTKHLTSHADDRRGRLRLFLKICDAIGYAHQRGVIHRDLKPSNILVTVEHGSSGGAGTPDIKVLDFGLARITDADVAATAIVSQAGQVVGTLAYMSPEQARGNPDEIDLRSDVYSLGVILYELLTGSLPYEFSRTHEYDAARVISETPPRPMARVGGRGGPRIDREIETITLKALEKEPGRRYQSVLALAEDLERYLGNLPILARPPSTAYLIRKLVGRHKVGVAFVATLFALLTGFAAAMTAQSARIARERDKAERLSEFLLELFAVPGPERSKGSTITARELLDRGARRIESDLTSAPEVTAAFMSSMARAYVELGLYDQSLPLARRALDLRTSALGPSHIDTAASLYALAVVLWRKNQTDEAITLHREALEIRRRRLGTDDARIAESLVGLGNAYFQKGQYDDALTVHREAIDIARRDPRRLDLLALAAQALATDLHTLGRPEEAEGLYRESLDALRRDGQGDSPRMGPSLFNLAMLRADRGDYAGSEALFVEGLALYRKALGDAHPEVARNLNNFAVLLQSKGDLAAAEHAARESQAIYLKVQTDHPDLAPTLDTLSGILNAANRSAAAEPLARQAVALSQKTYGPDHPYVAFETVTLADALSGLHRWAEAEALYRRSLEILHKQLPPRHPDTVPALMGLGLLLTYTRRPSEAEPLLKDALEIRRLQLGDADWRAATAGSALGLCLLRQARREDAERLLLAADGPLQKRGSQTGEARTNRARLVELYEAWGRPDRAAPFRPAPVSPAAR